jgi:hypothetical protein
VAALEAHRRESQAALAAMEDRITRQVAFLHDLLDPERWGLAVSDEVRRRALACLEPE